MSKTPQGAEWKPVSASEGLWSSAQVRAFADQMNPASPLNLLKRINHLERRIAALEAENEQLKAGK